MRFAHHFYNWDWNLRDTDLRLQLTKEAGYDGFELHIQHVDESARELREKSAGIGLGIAGVAGGSRPMAQVIDYAKQVGSPNVRTMVPKDECSRWVEYAAERGISLVVHNHIQDERGGVEGGEDLLRYLDERPGVCACPDTGHLLLTGSDPVETIRALGDRIRLMHLKDLDPKAVGTYERNGELFWELGTGALDLPGVMAALDEIGYDGWVTVERDARTTDYARSARNMREVLRKIGR